MEIKGLNHIAVNTKNLKDSVEFYSNVLRFNIVNKVDFPDHSMTYIAFPGGSMELFYYNNPKEVSKRAEQEIGLRHICFEVDEIQAWENRLKDADIEFCLPVTTIEELGMKVLLCYDPNGVVVELCEKI